MMQYNVADIVTSISHCWLLT